MTLRRETTTTRLFTKINRRSTNACGIRSSHHRSGRRTFWTLAYNNFTYSSSTALTPDDGSIITSSKEKAGLFAKSFATTSTINPPENQISLYFHGFCSSDLSPIIPPLYRPARETHKAVAPHQYTVDLQTSRTVRSNRSFTPRAAVECLYWDSQSLILQVPR